MSTAINSRLLRPERDTLSLLFKWIVALFVPVAVFTFIWSGEAMVNNVLLGIFSPQSTDYTTSSVIQASIFLVIFYATIIAMAGYMVAADSGRRSIIELWMDILVFVLVPLLLIYFTNNLLIGLAVTVIVWGIYFFVRGSVRKIVHYTPPAPLENLKVIDAEQRAILTGRATLGGFWFATILAAVWLIVDVIFFVLGSFAAAPVPFVIWIVLRTVLLPVAGYYLGRLGGWAALRRVLTPKTNGNEGVSKQGVLAALSTSRAKEEVKDLVPNDQPLRSTGAQRFFIVILVAFVLFYPVLDPILFGSGTTGRLDGYGDAGYYVILALGLNIVVGFAGLLDLGYVAFFAIGAYSWALIGSQQFTAITGIAIHNPQIWSILFWPMLLGAALIAAFWGVVLGIPTLRLRGDYLAIVTLGFGEIIPIVFQEMDKYTNGVNGIPGVYSPRFFGLNWSVVTPIPYYYLILALIALLIFVNIRLRDSRLGRAWVAIREDEIAASSSGINLVNTKLFAFGAGAFFSGVAGVYHAAKLGTISPDAFSSQDSIIYLAMVVIGGIGSIPGVIVGAFVVYAINLFILAQLDTLASDPGNFLHVVLLAIQHVIPSFTFGNIRNLIFGIILVTVMIFRPEGLIPSARRRRELHRTETEAPEEGALDVVPGAPGFEAEVRVE